MKEQTGNAQKDKHRNNGNGSANDWLNNMNADKVISNAQRILTTAVDVLEEEIAAGILAAKKLEKKVIDVDDLRKDPEELMSRVRRDTHDAVDIFMDALTVLTNHLGSLTEMIIKVKDPKPEKKSEAHIPVVKNDSLAAAGEEINIPLMISNDSMDHQIAIELIKCDLSGVNGNKISSRCMKILPKSFLLGANEQKEVTIKVMIPGSCKGGTYSGLVHDTYDPDLRTVVTVSVA